MDRPGVRQVTEDSGEQGKMEETGCEIICGAPTTLAVNGWMREVGDPKNGGLLLEKAAHSVWLRDFAHTAVSRDHSRWCTVNAESEKKASLSSTEVTRQQYSVSFGSESTRDGRSLSLTTI